MTNQKLKLIIASTAALVAELLAPALVGVAHAAVPQFTQAWVRPDTHKALTHTGVMVCATPSGASTTATEAAVKITFPTQTAGTDYVINSTAANWTVDTTNLPSGATAWPGIGTATAVSGHTVTFPSTDLTAGVQYCFHTSATNTLTNGSAGASSGIVGATLLTQDSTPATINQTNWSTAIITDDTITVSAVVPPNFTITLDGNSDAFPANLDPGQISSTGGRTVTIVTNAVGGWIAWVKDSQQGLYSTTANYTIPTINYATSPADLTAGTEGYALDVDLTTDAAGGCTVAVDGKYNSASGIGGGGLTANFAPIAACTRPGLPPGTSDGDVLTLIERATIRGGTPAGSDYSDVLTVVGAGNF